jgi:hypothetical protein
LEDPQIESVLVLCFRVGDDSIDEDGSREIMIEHAAVNDSLSQIFNLQGKGDVSEGCMDPAQNLLARGLRLCIGKLVHRLLIYCFNYQLSNNNRNSLKSVTKYSKADLKREFKDSLQGLKRIEAEDSC